jgi:hypothetical protein
MLSSLNAAAELSYITVLPSQSVTANGNSAGINVSTYEGILAVRVESGVGSGTTPVYTGYFQTGPNSNGGSAVNVAFAYPNGTAATTFVTNNTNQSFTFGIAQRACDKYLFLIGTIAGANTPAATVSATLIAQPKYVG